MDDTRTPVIVAVSQVTERDDRVENLGLAVRVAADALGQAPMLASRIQRLTAVGALLAPATPTMASDLADALHIDPADRELTTAGGHTPQWLVTRAATDIASGRLDGTLIVGAEAAHSHRARGDGGATPFNARRPAADSNDGDVVVGAPERGLISNAEIAAGLVLPTTVYPVFDSALAAQAGRTFAEHREVLAETMARLTTVAEANPYAWFRQQATAGELASTDNGNRVTAEPYTKRMNAFPYVDQAAALVVCSLAVARDVGLADQAIFVWSGAEAQDVIFVGARPHLGRSEGAEAAAGATYLAAGVGPDDVGCIDVYSCFPSAVQMASRALGVGVDDPRGLTVTGGLPYFGGPGNNYTTHAIATMVDRLRATGGLGVCTGLGGWATKHAVGVYAADPPTAGFRCGDTTQRQAEIDAGALPLVESADPGATGTIDGNTVEYAKDGTVTAAPAIIRLDDGPRICARAAPAELTDLAGQLLVGRRARLIAADDAPTYEVLD
jgi:acetyl-CoA C-acetyltransferase